MPELPVVVLWAVKATPLLLGAWLVTLPLHRASAATRHFIWVVALGGALLLPLAGFMAPRWEIRLPRPTAAPAGSVAPVAPITAVADVVSAAPVVSPAPIAPAASVAPALPSVGMTWAAGASLVAFLIVVSLWGTSRVARRATLVRSGPVADQARALAGRLGVGRSVRLLQASDRAMPMTWGSLRPAILLPAGIDDWPAGRREAVLLHELAHVKRWDWLTQLLARVVCALYWWHPLAWLGARRLREERELACDDLVLAQGTVASGYAHDLLEIARALRPSPVTALAGVAMARRSQLAGRLLAVLDAGRARGSLTRWQALPAGAVVLALVLPLAGLASGNAAPPRPNPGDPGDAPPRLAAMNATVSTTPAGAGIRRLVQARAATLCDWTVPGGSSSSSTSIHDDDHRMMIQIARDDCSLTVRAEGEITFADDDRDVSRLARNGSFEIEERSGANRRRVEITEKSGSLERRWFVDGGEQPYADPARAWLGDALLMLIRRAGINAEARAIRIFNSQGADGLIAEIANLQGDYVSGQYYQVLFARATLSSAQLVRLIEDAAGRVSSSYELGRVLTQLAGRGPLDGDVQRAYVRAADRMDSDYERGQAFVALASKGPLDVGTMDLMLASASRFDSDYERAQLMLTVGERYPSGRPLPVTYLAAIGRMDSDYERGRVLAALLARDPLSPRDRAGVLEVVATMESDHERAELLVAVIEQGRLDAATRDVYFRAAGGLESSYERERVLTAVIAGGPDEATMLAVLQSTSTLDSDHSKAEVLVAAAHLGLATASVRSAYAAAAQTIDSEYDRQRALEAAGLKGT